MLTYPGIHCWYHNVWNHSHYQSNITWQYLQHNQSKYLILFALFANERFNSKHPTATTHVSSVYRVVLHCGDHWPLCLVSGHYWSQVHTWPNLWSLYPWSHTALILVAYLVNWAVVLTCVSVCCPAVVGETTVRDSQIMTTLSSHYWITQYTHYHLGLEVFEGLLRFCSLGFLSLFTQVQV